MEVVACGTGVWDHYCGEVTDRNVGRSASAEGGAAAVYEVPGEKLIRDSSRCVLVPYVHLVEVESGIKVLSWHLSPSLQYQDTSIAFFELHPCVSLREPAPCNAIYIDKVRQIFS